MQVDITVDGVKASYRDDPADPPFVGVLCGGEFMFMRLAKMQAGPEIEFGVFKVGADGRTATKRSRWEVGDCWGVCEDKLARK